MAENVWGNLASRGACLAAGVWAAVMLTHGLQAPIQWTPAPKPRPVRVAVKAAPAPQPAAVAVAPRQVLPLKTDHAPVKPKRPKPVPVPTAPVAASAPVEVVAPAPTPTLAQPLPTLAQPAIAPPKLADAPVLPMVPGSEVPPAPADATAQTNPEKPGGPVLVLELTVNDQGVVIDSRILVPSSNGLGDVALALAVKGQRWTGLTPPLAPGEQRRLEIRVPYADAQVATPADPLP
jgi:hypothetical protein